MRFEFELELFGYRLASGLKPSKRVYADGVERIDGADYAVGSPAWRTADDARNARARDAAVEMATAALRSKHADEHHAALTQAVAAAESAEVAAARLRAERDVAIEDRRRAEDRLQHERIAAKAAERGEGRN